jgi:hypothetical protein
MLLSVTRLRVRSTLYMPLFFWHTFFSQRQVARAPGFLGGKLLPDAHRTFWTMTLWQGEREMKAFRGSQAHAKAMRLAQWCDEGAYVHWSVDETGLPSWTLAYGRLQENPRMSRVAHPSADHEARRFAPPRIAPFIERPIPPVAPTRAPK